MNRLDDLGHETRYSDSSQYDEVCIHCGCTDSVYDKHKRISKPCPVKDKTLRKYQ